MESMTWVYKRFSSLPIGAEFKWQSFNIDIKVKATLNSYRFKSEKTEWPIDSNGMVYAWEPITPKKLI